jgi:predicted transcriptional regulator
MPTVYEPPRPIGATKQQIESFAEQIAERVGYSQGAELEPIVERLGGQIEYFPLKGPCSKTASITVEEGRGFTIRLFQTMFPLSRRMSIAHELGHLFLHSQFGTVALEASHDIGEEDEGAEREARQFAYAFLMPAGAVKDTVEMFGRDSLAVAAVFMVPEPAAHRRMNDVCG